MARDVILIPPSANREIRRAKANAALELLQGLATDSGPVLPAVDADLDGRLFVLTPPGDTYMQIGGAWVLVGEAPVTHPTFSAHRNSVTQSIAGGAFVKLLFTVADWNVGGCYDTTTSRFTPDQPGKYLIEGNASFFTPVAAIALLTSVFKNGVEFKRGSQVYVEATATTATPISAIVDLNGAGDYVELFAYQTDASPITMGGTPEISWFQAVKVG